MIGKRRDTEYGHFLNELLLDVLVISSCETQVQCSDHPITRDHPIFSSLPLPFVPHALTRDHALLARRLLLAQEAPSHNLLLRAGRDRDPEFHGVPARAAP